MLEDIRDISFEIVLKQKDSNKIGIAPRAEDVPGKGNDQERSDCDRMEHPERGAPVLRRERPNPNRASCQNNRRRTLGEHSKPEKCSEQANCRKVASVLRQRGISRAAQYSSLSQYDCSAGHRNRDGSGEEHVRCGCAREPDGGDARGKEQRGEQCRAPRAFFKAVMFPSEPRDAERCDESGKRRRESRRPFRWQMQPESDGGCPVVKDRFLEPRAAVESRCNPISGLGHGARDPGVARLVRSEEANGSQVTKQTDQRREANRERRQELSAP